MNVFCASVSSVCCNVHVIFNIHVAYVNQTHNDCCEHIVDTVPPAPRPVGDLKFVSPDWNYQQQALMMLADITASLLDVIYPSEEKDKVVPFLSTIMCNVFPYLRNHR